jgi:hypothetical protein
MRESNKNKPSLLLLLLRFIVIFAFGLICIIGSGGGGGGGGGGSDPVGDVTGDDEGGTETVGAGGEIIELKAVMGPIVDADVDIAPLDNTNNIIAYGTTQDSDDLNEAGSVSVTLPEGYSGTPLYIRVSGGQDIDVADDGIRDETPTPNDVSFEFAVPTPEDLEGMRIVANPLLLYASPYVIAGLSTATNLPEGYEPNTDPEAVRLVMKRVARAIIEQDVSGDGKVDWEDIVVFDPLIHQDYSRIPWEFVLDEVERSRSSYYAELTLNYSTLWHLDPGTLKPYDWDGDGDWRDDHGDALGEYQEHEDMFGIYFSTNLDGYTVQDLIDGQGARGGQVILPEGAAFTYDWEDLYGNSGSETNDTQPPLLVHSGFRMDQDLGGVIGDDSITDPLEAPVGEYIIQYTTGDGLSHEERLYLHENSPETYFYVVPEITVDSEGFIEQIAFSYEDENGNALDDPPFISGYFDIAVAGDRGIDTFNSVVRGEGYYVDEDEYSDSGLFRDEVSVLTPFESFYPTNNGHKIYFEDVGGIMLIFRGGDGVDRKLSYHLHRDLYPQLDRMDWDYPSAGQVYVVYVPSTVTNREVVSIRYRFDNTDWTEVEVDTVTINIPDGATTFYVTAKDTSGFYFYYYSAVDGTQVGG